jgi:hypothetical protein
MPPNMRLDFETYHHRFLLIKKLSKILFERKYLPHNCPFQAVPYEHSQYPLAAFHIPG